MQGLVTRERLELTIQVLTFVVLNSEMDIHEGLDIEVALEAAGNWGRFQKYMLILSFVSAVPNAFAAINVLFSQYEPYHHCSYPAEYVNKSTNLNVSTQDIVSTIIPLELNDKNIWVKSQCKIYDRNYSEYPVLAWPQYFKSDNSSTAINCNNGITWILSDTERTAVMDFSMICDDDWKAPVAVSMYQVGMMVAPFSGVLGDWYGRRPIFIISCVLQVTAQAICALSWNYIVYCIAIVLVGVFGLTNYLLCFVLVTEVTGYRWRNFITISSFFGFSAGYCSVALFAYAFPKWRIFLGVMSAAGALLYFPCCWFFPESPRWLAQKGRSDDAIRYLRVIAKQNDREERLEKALKNAHSCVTCKGNVPSTGITETTRVLFKSGIATRFCTVVYGWLITSSVYFAFTIYSADFSDDRFLNCLFGGLAETPAYVLVLPLMKYFGRPRTVLLLMIICGISSISLPFLPSELPLTSTIFAILGKASISAVFFTWYLMSTEIVPTLQRSAAISICSAVARIGSFGTPYLMYTRKYNYFAPNVFMGVATIISGILGVMYVPETLGVAMPDTVEEARQNKRFYRWHLFKSFPKTTSHTRQKIPASQEEKESILD